jgi:hypothetical protein
MKRRTKIAVVVCVDLFLALFLLFFLLPIVPGITGPTCVYFADEHQSLSFEQFGVGTVYEFGHFLWFWSRPIPIGCG